MVEAILEAAARVLEAGGLEGFNTNRVAEAAGVSVGSLYQYFPGKQALLAALVRQDAARLREALAAVPRGDLRTTAESLVAVVVAHQLERPVLARLLDFAERDLGLEDEDFAAVADWLAGTLAPFAATPAEAAHDLIVIVRALSDSGIADPADLHRRIMRAVMGYLATG
jgi:AcrR family transcriptional regulator